MRLSVILVNYKTPDLTIAAVKTLLEHTPWIKTDGEVLVIDNASGDESATRLRNELPEVLLIENADNTGFSGGNNVGMDQAKGDYVLLLNTDTISIEDAITPILEWMDEHKDVGVATVKLLNEDRSIQETGGFFPTLPRVFTWMFFLDDLPYFSKFFKSFHPDSRSYNKEKSFYKTEHELDWVTGAFFLIKREIIDTIGTFDEKMFMYAEEMEYCWRIKKHNWRIAYVPIAQIIHLRGKSSASLRSPLLGEYKNIIYFYKKHMSFGAQLSAVLLLKLGAIIRIIVFAILGKKEVAGIYVEALRTI